MKYIGSAGVVSVNGILFNNDTAAANILDDYEEGLWTPTIIGSISNPTQSYAYQDGKYTKIGDMVFVHFYCQFAASGISAGTGYAYLSQLPFVVRDFVYAGGPIAYMANWTDNGPIAVQTIPNTSNCYLVSLVSGASSILSATAIKNSTVALGTLVYRT